MVKFAVVLLLSTVQVAAASTITDFVSINWTNPANPALPAVNTTGFFTVDTVGPTLVDFKFTVPAPFGTVTPANSSSFSLMIDSPAVCGASNPCFTLSILQAGTYNFLTLNFVGDPTAPGPILQNAFGTLSAAICSDPCFYSATSQPGPPPVPEPATILLVVTGVLVFLRRTVQRSA